MTRKNAAEINQVLRQIKGLRTTRTIFGSYGQQRGFLFTEKNEEKYVTLSHVAIKG